MMARIFTPLLLAATTLLSPCHAAWPEQPIRIVVSAPAGSMGDLVARMLAEDARKTLGQPLVIENRAGAGGNIALNSVAQAKPDGYTVLLGSASNFAVNQFLYRDLTTDPRVSLAPVTALVDVPLAIFVNSRSSYRTFSDLVDAARANRGKLNYASPGGGTMGHLFSEQINRSKDLGMVHVAYKGGPPAVLALMGGEVDAYVVGAGFAAPQVRSGALRALAVSSAHRLAVLPEVPTFSEVGLTGIEASTWWGVAAPSGTSKDRIERLATALSNAMLQPHVQASLKELSVVGIADGPEPMRQRIQREAQFWESWLKVNKVKID
jgi:tripartite-type tricarboxylate transporter receptor subunit TctC